MYCSDPRKQVDNYSKHLKHSLHPTKHYTKKELLRSTCLNIRERSETERDGEKRKRRREEGRVWWVRMMMIVIDMHCGLCTRFSLPLYLDYIPRLMQA